MRKGWEGWVRESTEFVVDAALCIKRNCCTVGDELDKSMLEFGLYSLLVVIVVDVEEEIPIVHF